MSKEDKKEGGELFFLPSLKTDEQSYLRTSHLKEDIKKRISPTLEIAIFVYSTIFWSAAASIGLETEVKAILFRAEYCTKAGLLAGEAICTRL